MPDPVDLVVAGRVVTPDGERTAAVAVADGRIVAVDDPVTERPARRRVELAGDEVLLPGLVDTHVHVNEPGRTDWEGFDTATRAAAAGGITALVDMPLNSIPPTTDVAALETKRAAAAGRCHVDVAFWGGAVPGNLDQLAGLHRAGVAGVKCFLPPSGVDEFPPLAPADLRRYLAALAGWDGLLIVHAEDPAVLDAAPPAGGPGYRRFLESRPAAAEDAAIAAVLDAAADTGARVHIVHLSSAGALARISAARAAGVRVTVETCPHYLTFAAEDIADGATEYKCCPPIREAANREALWEGLAAGTVDLVVSDHSPCPPALKAAGSGDFAEAWGGIASLQVALAAVWTGAAGRGHGLADVARWMAQRPAELAGLGAKGRIAVGADADLAVFLPEHRWTVDGATLAHRHPVTPYHGLTLRGRVSRVWLRGAEVDGTPTGRLLVRDRP